MLLLKNTQNPYFYKGFTLLEVLISMTILISIMLASIQSLSNQLQFRTRLAGRERAAHMLNLALARLHDDFRNAYFAEAKVRVQQGRGVKNMLVWKPSQQIFQLTTHSFRSFTYGTPETPMAFVRYEVRPNETTNKQQLIRIVDTNLTQDTFASSQTAPSEQVLIEDLAAWDVSFWNGESFDEKEWDTDSPDYGNKLPKMVKITLEAYVNYDDPELTQSQEKKDTYKLETIVFLLNAAKKEQVKQISEQGYKWQ